ncbi:Ldb18p Ecym_8421 [Eremothecium cymbalariae DBVPG|uniref:Uncharacterized protein n=1 Tax=Eremothecium cymbalariae (strain CBS 270.75 / DBVPG 7215 / KCTC 17166 / NRRL Y-17582) TaxID=931890 RepID=G8JXW6_ERECY|nr:Hypothetical protein Ecym_8421 [Eremothecium cymbalariae DBVPG\
MGPIMLNELEKRVEALEGGVGDANDDAAVCARVGLLMKQLRELTQRGFRYNEQMSIYMEHFSGQMLCDEVQDWGSQNLETIVESCSEEIEKMVSMLQELELGYNHDFDRVLKECGGIMQSGNVTVDVSQLSELYKRCNRLAIGSIHITLRFIRQNHLTNEFCHKMERILLEKERELP